MGFWDKVNDEEINDAHGTKGGLYLCPGNFIVQVQRCKMIKTRQKHEAFVGELLVIESDVEELPAGAKPSFYVDMDGKFPELSLGNVADFIRNGLASLARQHGEEHPPVEDIELTAAIGKAVTGADNLLAGVFLRAYAFNKKTREGNNFTRIDWSVPDTLNELLAAA